ncbi:hypothetical protein BHM03_00031408, partial [Ensete ventricosum]
DPVLEGGIPFKKAHGITAFEHHGNDPRFNSLFNDSTRNHSIILNKQPLETYRCFDDVKVLVDVGGGTGATLHMITSKHSHIKGINFDLPHVISGPALRQCSRRYPSLLHPSFASTGLAALSLNPVDTTYASLVLRDNLPAAPIVGRASRPQSIATAHPRCLPLQHT